jgi:molybdopterin converting factor small subunit
MAVHVQVRVFATLRRHVPELPVGGALELEVSTGTTLAALRDRLGLPPEEVRVVMRNHLQAEWNEAVQEGDRIAFVPAIAGG